MTKSIRTKLMFDVDPAVAAVLRTTGRRIGMPDFLCPSLTDRLAGRMSAPDWSLASNAAVVASTPIMSDENLHRAARKVTRDPQSDVYHVCALCGAPGLRKCTGCYTTAS